jgi:hypothetical protein
MFVKLFTFFLYPSCIKISGFTLIDTMF